MAVRPEAAEDFRPAGFWIRLVATIVDMIVLGVVTFIILKLLGLGTPPEITIDPGNPDAAVGLIMSAMRQVALASAVSMLIGLFYSVIFVGWCGQTPGKMLLGLKIIRVDGGEADYIKAFIRWIGYLISALPLAVGYIMAAFTENKRALHDYIAGTRVVHL
jgi:uncharacterized RDD family membrane protein YckC